MSRFVPLHISLQQKDQTTFNSLYSPPFFKRSIPTNHLSRAFIIVSLHFIYVHSLSVLCLSVCVCTYGLMFLTACMSVVKKPSSASAMMLLPQNPARRERRGEEDIYIYMCVCVCRERERERLWLVMNCYTMSEEEMQGKKKKKKKMKRVGIKKYAMILHACWCSC